MSFGRVPRSRGHGPGAGAACPCGSGAVFGDCCGPVLDGGAAPTAERLMRSRFTAFAVGDEAHLMSSWHPATRPDRLDLDDDVTWERLEIDFSDGESGGEGEGEGVRASVTFRAHWRDRGTGARGVLSETSRFRRVNGRWVYLDGVVDRRTV